MSQFLPKTALVTGGAGFIGSHLVGHLIASGWKVRVLDDLSTGQLGNLDPIADKVDFIHGSVTDEATLVRVVAGVEVIFHLAAKVFVPESFEKPMEYERVNVLGTAGLLAAAKNAGVRRMVFSSTCAVYGETDDLPIAETAPTKPVSPYATNKLMAETLGSQAAALGGPAFTALRYFNVYGSRQDPRSPYSGVISKFADALRKGTLPVIYGDGQQTRDFIHVSDVARANLLAAQQSDPAFATYNIGSGSEISIQRLWEIISAVSRTRSGGLALVPDRRPARPGDISRSRADTGLAQRALGWSPSTTPEAGLKEIMDSIFSR